MTNLKSYATKRKFRIPNTRRKTNNLFNAKSDDFGIYGKHHNWFMAWVLLRCTLVYLVPAFLIFQLPFIIIGMTMRAFDLMPENTASNPSIYLVPIYAFVAYKASRRFADHMSLYRYIANVKYHDINRQAYATSNYTNPEREAFRMRVNKGLLFPSRNDLEVLWYVENTARRSRQDSSITNVGAMLEKVSIDNRAREHESAYRIADEKVAEGAEVNEYDDMVQKYATKTVDEIRPHFG